MIGRGFESENINREKVTLRVIMFGLQYKLSSLKLLADMKDNSELRTLTKIVSDLLYRYNNEKIFDIDELQEEGKLND